LNVITLTGNNVKEIEITYNTNGTAFAKGTIAVQRNYKNRDNEYISDFINFKAIGKMAETLANYVKKGDRFGITGSLEINTSEKDGKKYFFTDVVINSFDFPQKKSGNSGNTSSNSGNNPPNDPFEGVEIEDDSLPF
jgi:single-strand DNA-binding protein